MYETGRPRSDKTQGYDQCARTCDCPARRHRNLQEQAQSNALAWFSPNPDLHREFLTAVIGAPGLLSRPVGPDPQQPGPSQKLLAELCRSSARS